MTDAALTDQVFIEQLVRKVLAGLRDAQSRESFSSCFLILGKREDTDMDKLIPRLPKGAKTVFMEDRVSAQDLPGQTMMSHLREREYEGIILPSLSMTAMADLAMGRASGDIGAQVLELLMSGYRVSVLEFQYTQFRDTAPPALWQLYESHRKTLEDFGISTLAPATEDDRTVQKTLVTQADIEQLHTQGVSTLKVARRAIVTGLAEDSARDLGIKIQRI